MRLEGIRAVLFDLDDTLYSEREYTRSGARAVTAFLERHALSGAPSPSPGGNAGVGSKAPPQTDPGLAAGARAPSEEDVRGVPGALDELLVLEADDPAGPLYSRWLARKGWDEQLWLPELLRIHREHRPAICLEPEARELLPRLRSRYRLGLVTDGRLEQQHAKADALGLTGLFDALVFSDALGRERWKPHPAPYHRALELLGARPSEAVYVGDNPAKDFLGARRAGMRSVRFRRPEGLHAAVEPESAEVSPDVEIRSLDELEGLLSRAESATL